MHGTLTHKHCNTTEDIMKYLTIVCIIKYTRCNSLMYERTRAEAGSEGICCSQRHKNVFFQEQADPSAMVHCYSVVVKGIPCHRNGHGRSNTPKCIR